jgi:hypothetical protein
LHHTTLHSKAVIAFFACAIASRNFSVPAAAAAAAAAAIHHHQQQQQQQFISKHCCLPYTLSQIVHHDMYRFLAL